ncbi:MAG TPA: hypothetical protein VIV11_33295 [Kofleriaceae bacterium]
MRIGEILIEQRKLRADDLTRALSEKPVDKRLCSFLIAKGLVDFDDASRALGEQRGAACALAKHLAGRDPALARLIPAELGRGSCVLPIGRSSKGSVIVCVRDPAPALLRALEQASKSDILMVITPASRLESLVMEAYGSGSAEEFDVDFELGHDLPAPPPSRVTRGPLPTPPMPFQRVESPNAFPRAETPPPLPPLPDMSSLDPESIRLSLTDLDDVRVTKDPAQSGLITRMGTTLPPSNKPITTPPTTHPISTPPATHPISTPPYTPLPPPSALAGIQPSSTPPPPSALAGIQPSSTTPPPSALAGVKPSSTLPPPSALAGVKPSSTTPPPSALAAAQQQTSPLPLPPPASLVGVQQPRSPLPSALATTTQPSSTPPPPTSALAPGTEPSPPAFAAATQPSSTPPPPTSAFAAATNLPRKTAPSSGPAKRPMSFETMTVDLANAQTREAATEVVLAYVATRWSAGLVLAIRDRTAIGYRGHGVVAPESVTVSLGSPSTVQRAVQTRFVSIEAPAGVGQSALVHALNRPSTPAAAPVVVNGQPVAVIAVSDPLSGPQELAAADLAMLAEALGSAYKRIMSG